jgi:DNA-directed RNA polymerase specialized sigma24 family protein
VNSGEQNEYDPGVHKELDEADWPEILPRLLKYARARAKTFRFVGIADVAPDDLVGQAIILAYSGKRRWNKKRYPELINFLISIIKSIANHKLQHYFQFKRDSLALDDVSDKSKELAQLSPEDPEAIVTEKDSLLNLQKVLHEAVSGDEEAGMVLLCIETGKTKPKEIAEETGYDVKQINNIFKRLRRKTEDVKKIL